MHRAERTASAAQSVLRLLRFPLILDNILQNTDEGEQLRQELPSALTQRSVQERQRVRSFASALCYACDDLLSEGLSLVDEDIGVEYGQAQQQKYKGKAVFKDEAELEPSMETPIPICLAPITNEKNDDTFHEGCDEMASNDAQPCVDLIEKPVIL